MSDDLAPTRDLDETMPACTCGGIETPYGTGHRGNCAIMEWHDLQIIMHLRVECSAKDAEIATLRAALRSPTAWVATHADGRVLHFSTKDGWQVDPVMFALTTTPT